MNGTRREFLKLGAGVASLVGSQLKAMGSGGALSDEKNDLEFRSSFIHAQMATDQPSFVVFDVDSLGKEKTNGNVMLPLEGVSEQFAASREGQIVKYRRSGNTGYPNWEFEFGESRFTVRSSKETHEPLVLRFGNHATLLGSINDSGAIQLPAVLHFPSHGTLRITTETPGAVVDYDATRGGDNQVTITLPSGGRAHRFEVAAVYPEFSGAGDSRYDGYRRDFLSMFQLNPRRRCLANNSASDACAFTVFEYAMMAAPLPALAPGLSALDLIRQTLDRYIGEMKGYGMIGYQSDPRLKFDFLDTYPSLVIAASIYVRASGDADWARRNYSIIKTWADKLIEFDHDGDGLMEYPLSGNSGSWIDDLSYLPSNWWDTIGFGHKDAYSNALAYKAFQDMAEFSSVAGFPKDANLFEGRARKLKEVYYDTFYNLVTGVLAGWKSADGKLHDYYFLFVNGMAVTYDLVSLDQGNRIWDKLLAKMDEAGYRRFDLGLPGNLIPVRREDYASHSKRWGYSEKPDGSDGFQIYENGGATACYAYYTVRALQMLGRQKEADVILYPMLEGFASGRFQGRGPNGRTYDWIDWNGSPNGYEGLLVDNYLTLLAAIPMHLPK